MLVQILNSMDTTINMSQGQNTQQFCWNKYIQAISKIYGVRWGENEIKESENNEQENTQDTEDGSERLSAVEKQRYAQLCDRYSKKITRFSINTKNCHYFDENSLKGLFLTEWPSLTHLTINNFQNLISWMLKNISAADWPNIQKLDLEQNEITESDSNKLEQCLGKWDKITYINLNNNKLKNGMSIIHSLKCIEQIQALHLNKNEIENTGLKTLMQGKDLNWRCLKVLSLSSNNITYNGIRYLIYNQIFLINIQKLTLSHNKISDKGFHALLKSSFLNLSELFLENCGITNLVFSSLRKCQLPKLYCFQVGGNLISKRLILNQINAMDVDRRGRKKLLIQVKAMLGRGGSFI